MALTVSVCVCTFRRRHLLERTLRSLIDQERDDSFKYSIVVIDNDQAESARDVVESFQTHSPIELVYDAEPVQNIARARNRCLQLANSEFVAFIDDDQIACKNWLTALLGAVREWNADVVHGPVKPQFAPAVSEFYRSSQLYDSPNPADGAIEGYGFGTGNCLLRRSVFHGLDHMFNEAYGLTGGEDWDFFRRLQKTDCRFVWSRSAVVQEWIPAERATVSYLCRRVFRSELIIRSHLRNVSLGQKIRTVASLGFPMLKTILLLAGRAMQGQREACIQLLKQLAGFAGRIAALAGLRDEFYMNRKESAAASMESLP